jgi:putative transposase
MAKPRMDPSAFVGKLLEEHDGDVLREGVRVLAQALMESEVTGVVGADRHERSEDRTAYRRHGTRVRSWDTRMGTVELAIRKVRTGTYYPSLLQPRRRAEQALLTVVSRSLRARRADAEGGRSGEGAGAGWHLEIRGVPDLRRARPAD